MKCQLWRSSSLNSNTAFLRCASSSEARNLFAAAAISSATPPPAGSVRNEEVSKAVATRQGRRLFMPKESKDSGGKGKSKMRGGRGEARTTEFFVAQICNR